MGLSRLHLETRRDSDSRIASSQLLKRNHRNFDVQIR
jgi:hypothetical protein